MLTRGFKLSRNKNEYVEGVFRTNEITRCTIKFEEKKIVPNGSLKYLGSIFQKSGDIQQNMTRRTKDGWQTWRGVESISRCTL